MLSLFILVHVTKHSTENIPSRMQFGRALLSITAQHIISLYSVESALFLLNYLPMGLPLFLRGVHWKDNKVCYWQQFPLSQVILDSPSSKAGYFHSKPDASGNKERKDTEHASTSIRSFSTILISDVRLHVKTQHLVKMSQIFTIKNINHYTNYKYCSL